MQLFFAQSAEKRFAAQFVFLQAERRRTTDAPSQRLSRMRRLRLQGLSDATASVLRGMRMLSYGMPRG